MSTTEPAESRLAQRIAAVGGLGLLMLIPLLFVFGLVLERGERYDEVLRDIASTWGDAQHIQGPLVVVPYIESETITETVVDAAGRPRAVTKTVNRRRRAVFLPEVVDLEIDLDEERRYRGIYESLVYTADVSLTGRFGPIDVAPLSDRLVKVEWDKAIWVLGLSDTGAIAEAAPLNWGSGEVALAPGTRIADALPQGFHAPLPLAEGNDGRAFSLNLQVRGSGGIRFAPMAERTDVAVRSPWPHPSFQGSPQERVVDGSGFEARWSVPHLTRSYPQRWTLEHEHHNLHQGLAGVDLFEPVALYDKVERAVKYGILFVFLTFLIFLLFEIVAGVRLHPVQYGLVGLALCLFYVTLLATAEHTSFATGYLAATGVVVGMIAAYTGAALRSWRRAGLVGVLLGGLYGVLYAILRMEDFALLAGTGLLLAATCALMYATRDLGGRPAVSRGGPTAAA